MSKNRLLSLAGMLLILFCLGCPSQERSTTIDTSKTEMVKQQDPKQGHGIRIALGGMITPKEGLAYYREFSDISVVKWDVR